MRVLLLSAVLSLFLSNTSWAWPARTYVIVPAPAPGLPYVQPGYVLSRPQVVFYAQPAIVPAAVTYSPQVVSYAQPAAVQMPMASAPNDVSDAVARLQNEIRMLTHEANVRALQSRVLELERRQTSPPPAAK